MYINDKQSLKTLSTVYMGFLIYARYFKRRCDEFSKWLLHVVREFNKYKHRTYKTGHTMYLTRH